MNSQASNELFDRRRRRNIRDRAFRRSSGNSFLEARVREETLDRLSFIKRDFKKCLLIGQGAVALREYLENLGIKTFLAETSGSATTHSKAVQCDEDRLPFADHSFDLVINLGTLDSVNDLPGSLILTRRILKPDGLFLASLIGAESLTTLKASLMAAEGDFVSPHIHPQIDIRTMGDLISRSGFALPVIDSESLTLQYRELSTLIADIRDYGGSNILRDNMRSISKHIYQKAIDIFGSKATDDGKIIEQVEIIHLCGWAPHPDQPKPAQRGSGTMPLETALNKKTEN